MRILVAGATGVLGTRLVRQLADRGHDVFGLTRDKRGDDLVRAQGGEPLRASLFDPEEITQALESVETIIHVATAIPKKQRPSRKDWEANDRVRVEGTKSLVEVANQTGAEHLMFQSVVWVARPDDESPFDEDAPPNPDEITASAAEAERIALDAGQASDFVATVLRGGWFYAPDAWHTQTFGEALRKRMLPIIGEGQAFWSILHADDAASAFEAAVNQRPEGIYHVVDDGPVRVGDFFRYFAERQGAQPPRHIPVWLAKILAGSYAAEFATASTFTSAKQFKDATGWQPRYPNYRAGLDQIASVWESGTGRETA